MKRLIITILAVLLLTAPAFAAGSWGDWTRTPSDEFQPLEVIRYSATATADSADGSYPTKSLDVNGANPVKGYHLFMVVTDPGATAPTDNYDITVVDEFGVDVMGGELTNRDTANTEQAVPLVGGAYGSRFVENDLTVTPTGNSENSATFTIYLYFYKFK
jgi:hypothetical protein